MALYYVMKFVAFIYFAKRFNQIYCYKICSFCYSASIIYTIFKFLFIPFIMFMILQIVNPNWL